MESQIKIDQSLLKKINEIRDKFQTIVFNLGEIQIQRMEIEKSIESLNSNEQALIRLYSETQSEEEKVTDELIKNYGEGSLDLKNGIYIKN